MALTDGQREELLSSTSWSFSNTELRAALIKAGIADGKTFAQAVTYADTYGNGFLNKTDLERERIFALVDTGMTGALDDLVSGTAPKPHSRLSADDLSPLQFKIALYLYCNGESLGAAITGAQGVASTKQKTEAVLYFLICGEDLATAKTSAGV